MARNSRIRHAEVDSWLKIVIWLQKLLFSSQ